MKSKYHVVANVRFIIKIKIYKYMATLFRNSDKYLTVASLQKTVKQKLQHKYNKLIEQYLTKI